MRVAVLGAGSWGTTLASLAAHNNETVLWARESEVADEITGRHRNSRYLEGLELHEELSATTELRVALDGADLVVVAVPSKFLRAVLGGASDAMPPDAVVLSAAKGIEPGSGASMSVAIREELGLDPGRVGVISGPNLAKEVLAGHPSATVLACTDREVAERFAPALSTPTFRVFTNTDVVGCEFGGAVKNVIAIAAGIGDGLGYGWNTKAALITRGLTEIARLGIELGADPITFLGLAGNGDLTATCSSSLSRNRGVGEQLGAGRSLDEIIAEMNMVAEGVSTTPAICELAQRCHVPMPISRQVDAVLRSELSPGEAVAELMGYEPGSELDDLR